MKIFISHSNNPFFNLALEEFLFHKHEEEFFILYINEPSVICGKHQIPYKEINIEFVEKNNIFICRRFSGGGTVYHDEGNLNFCFISRTNTKEIQIDFRKFILPVSDFLSAMGLRVTLNERNNILIHGKKISGNAEHISKGRVLHHGTLLFDSDLTKLHLALKGNSAKYTDHSVQSVSSPVTNILPYLSVPINIKIFRNYLVDYLIGKLKLDYYELDESEYYDIFHLSVEKYVTPEWIYCNSPEYNLNNSIWLNKKNCAFSFNVKNGVINSFHVESDMKNILTEILTRAVDSSHSTDTFDKILSRIGNSNLIGSYIKSVNKYAFF